MTFRVQNQIRQNASDIRNYLDDLFTWEEEVNKHGKKTTKPTKQVIFFSMLLFKA